MSSCLKQRLYILYQNAVYFLFATSPFLQKLTMMQKHKNPIKLLSISSKLPSNHSIEKASSLQLQLQEARSYIQVLKKNNLDLMQKLNVYERKCQDMKIMEEELEFRRQQEKQMQEHLDNYQQINKKLRAQITDLQNVVKQRPALVMEKTVYPSKIPLSETKDQKYFHNSSTKIDEDSSLKIDTSLQHRKSVGGESSKQNHPLTPKSRVNINFDIFSQNQLNSMHQINARRKVFL